MVSARRFLPQAHTKHASDTDSTKRIPHPASNAQPRWWRWRCSLLSSSSWRFAHIRLATSEGLRLPAEQSVNKAGVFVDRVVKKLQSGRQLGHWSHKAHIDNKSERSVFRVSMVVENGQLARLQEQVCCHKRPKSLGVKVPCCVATKHRELHIYLTDFRRCSGG